MRHTFDLPMHELPGALQRTAQLLKTTSYRLSHLAVAPGQGGRAVLSVTIEAPPDASVTAQLERAMAGDRRKPGCGSGAVPSGRVLAGSTATLAPPFHWQADGAGDDRVG